MPRERKELGTPQAWLARARSNLTRAGQPRPDGVYWEDLCYDAQQAAEKALKALLLDRNIRFRFVHDLGELLNLLVQADIEMPEGLLEAAELTEYAVEARYPGPFEPVSEEEHRRALELATAVVDWVASEIARESP